MTKLKSIPPKTAEPSKPKILIFGKPGVGKTWAAIDYPSVFYIDTENGANLSHYTDKLTASGGSYLGIEQGSMDFKTIIEQVEALATEDHPYKTVVIDSISNVFNDTVTREGVRIGDKNVFGADKKPAISMMKRLIQWLNRLDMNVILICHEKPLWGMDEKGARSEIGTTFDCWDKLEYELHLCLRIEKHGIDRRAVVRKSRLVEFPEGTRFPWSYADFAEKYGRSVIEKNCAKTIIATPAQLAELDELFKIYRIDDEERDRWFKRACVESYQEMTAEQVAAIIKFIKNKLTGKEK